jgi:hypothetical protein
LDFLAKRKDFIQLTIKISPVRNIINLELPAQILVNGFDPINKLRKKSAPPNMVNKPMTATICMNSICFFGIFKARIEKRVKKKTKN